MNDLKSIKKKILQEDKIYDILESIGCEYINFEQSGTLVTAQLPDRFNSGNKRAVQCRLNDGLFCVIRNRNDFKGDIFNLISFLKFNHKTDELQNYINESKHFVCSKFGWNSFLDGTFKDRPDYLKTLKSFKSKSFSKIEPNKILNEEILQEFLPYPNQLWIDEGISYDTQVAYNIGFDLLTQRITIPYRNRFGQLVGVKGRSVLDDGSMKYLYLYNCKQSQELFNFHIAKDVARDKQEIIIVEGEKSCMKFFEHNIKNVIAIGSSDISETQRQMIYSLGQNVEIVLAYDNDKTVEDIQAISNKFKNRDVSMIFDTKKILKDKSAPIDSGIDVWYTLYNECKFDLESKEMEN